MAIIKIKNNLDNQTLALLQDQLSEERKGVEDYNRLIASCADDEVAEKLMQIVADEKTHIEILEGILK